MPGYVNTVKTQKTQKTRKYAKRPPEKQKEHNYKLAYLGKNVQNITKTRLYNFDPLKPHFYIVKLGFTRVYIIFLISVLKHRLGVFVRTAVPMRF